MVSGGTTMGRLPQNPPTPQRQVGDIYPNSQDEPGHRGRDIPHGLLIAPGILLRLVPGSPAVSYVGSGSAVLKPRSKALEPLGERFQRFGEVGAGLSWRARALPELGNLVRQQQ